MKDKKNPYQYKSKIYNPTPKISPNMKTSLITSTLKKPDNYEVSLEASFIKERDMLEGLKMHMLKRDD